MFKPETKILFQEPTADTRRLRSATVIESSPSSFSVGFDSEVIELDEGQELVAYFHGRREFMQQIVRVIAVAGDGDDLVLEIEPVGDAMSAERRTDDRATAISADIFAALGEDRSLGVEDVSSTGFAVVSGFEYFRGAALNVSLAFDGDIYSGTAWVQSILELGEGQIRYGLVALDEGDLRDGLQQISQAMQRQDAK
jgi:hypothetical protein